MKKLFFSLVILVSLGFLWFKVTDLQSQKAKQESQQADSSILKKEILRFALVADSHDDNQNLEIALRQAKSSGASFVIGLGDYTEVGTRRQLNDSKKIFDSFDFEYYFTAGDHDLWNSRDEGNEALTNFRSIFGEPTHVFNRQGVEFLIIDNSDIYTGISSESWKVLNDTLSEEHGKVENDRENSKSETRNSKLTFVFSHKTPYHPQSAHIMGEETQSVAAQAKEYLRLLEESNVDGFFSGDLHFFAQFSSYASNGSSGRSTSGGNSPSGVKITTIGAVGRDRNFQGPRFAIVKVYSDYGWEVEDVELR